MEAKIWWQSKELWMAAIAFVATAIQAKYGFVVSPEYQGFALTIVFFILRSFSTKQPLSFKKPDG
jgi:hypothetical protein